jgi:fluoride exporter
MSSLRVYLLVMLGGALGSGARVWISEIMTLRFGPFPWGTLLVNVIGSLLIGLAAGLLGPEGRFPAPLEVRAFIGLGIMGGFTTFSSFSLQTITLAQAGQYLPAVGYVVGSLALCLLGAWVGLLIGAR